MSSCRYAGAPERTSLSIKVTVRARTSSGPGLAGVAGAVVALVPDVPAGAAVMRCGTCHGISLASMETMPSADGPHEVECRTPLGRFAGTVWVPASNYVSRIVVARPKGVRAGGRGQRRR